MSFEPVYENATDYEVNGTSDLTISELTINLSKHYAEISSIKKDHNGFIQITVFGGSGEDSFYVNPFDGKRIGEVIETPAIFDFCRTLHRSLFFGEVGRFLVGLSATFLLLMSVSGFVLILKKQGGFKQYFKKIIKEDFYPDYHTKLGKLFLLVIVIISLTGGYLFFERFEVIPTNSLSHAIDFEGLRESPVLTPESFPTFKGCKVSDLREIIFPFSEFVDDFYELKLDDRELLINQLTGETVSEIRYPVNQRLSSLSFSLHTAEGQPWWAMLLGLSSLSILFFTFSGFKIYLKRAAKSSSITNPFKKEDCSIIIGLGSEMGTTLIYAKALHESLLDAGQKSYLTELNAYEHFASMQYLIVLTSTYGVGDPPANASRFMDLFKATRHSKFQYAVVGFGSDKYPDFCQFAIDVNQLLKGNEVSSELVPLEKINNRSAQDFHNWVSAFQNKMQMQLDVQTSEADRKVAELTVIEKTISSNPNDATFLLKLAASNGKLKNLHSGDLLVYTPEEDGLDRQYSMSVNRKEKTVLLSIKKHPKGIASGLLSEMEKNGRLSVSFQRNPTFHFPKQADHVLMIANGTGIAPFIGMIEENKKRIPVSLFWGGQNEDSFELYKPHLYNLVNHGRLNQLRTAFSRADEKSQYVQDVIKKEEQLIMSNITSNSVIMICGSIKMQKAVEEVLNELTLRNLNKPLQYFNDQGLVKTDCY